MNLAKYLSVVTATMFKFVGGPLTGLFLQLSWVETTVCSVVGMMLTVVLVIFLENFFRRILTQFFKRKKPRRKFTQVNRWAIKARQRFGLLGVAFLTPLILTPIGGTILALAFGFPKGRILLTMLLWAAFWGVVQTLFFYYMKALLV